MKILVTGKNGQVGRILREKLAPLGEVIAVGTEDCDFKSVVELTNLVEKNRPAIIVNPAAYTAVDKAESDREAAFGINATAPKILAAQANLLDIPLVHYSTDYVFDGEKQEPYIETDATNPQSIYGISKCMGEENIRAMTRNHLILRTSWVYGSHASNFLKTVLRLAREKKELRIIDDQYGAPTSTRLIGDVTFKLVEELLYGSRPKHELFGTYHLVPDGKTTWCSYAKKVILRAEQFGVKGLLQAKSIFPIASEEYPLPAKRPKNSCMSNSKMASFLGFSFPDWEDDIDFVLNEIFMGGVSNVF